jgi:steroid 5-alpha reductase family enzyme
VRLTSYLFYRILVTGKDERFDDKNRGFSLEFAAFWVVQAIWVMLVSSPVIILNARCDIDPAMGAADWVGLSMWLVGWLTETVADQQKFAFRQNPANKGRFCNTGLWAVSRHPNYFGEILLWWGLFMACVAVFPEVACANGACETSYGAWASVLGPLFLTFLLFYVSGIPLLEARAPPGAARAQDAPTIARRNADGSNTCTQDSADKRHGGKPEYLEYKRSTSVLVRVLTRPKPRARCRCC